MVYSVKLKPKQYSNELWCHFQEIFRIPKIKVEERKQTERELGENLFIDCTFMPHVSI